MKALPGTKYREQACEEEEKEEEEKEEEEEEEEECTFIMRSSTP